MLHQVGVSFDLYYDARKHKIKKKKQLKLYESKEYKMGKSNKIPLYKTTSNLHQIQNTQGFSKCTPGLQKFIIRKP